MDIKELKKLRIKNSWTQKNLADKLAVSVRTIQAWEQGIRVPRESILVLLDKIFDDKVEAIGNIYNKFYGIALNMKPDIKIVRMYTCENNRDTFVSFISSLENNNRLNGYSLFKLTTYDILIDDLLMNNDIIKFSQIKDIEITQVYQKGLLIKDIKKCQLRVTDAI